MSQENVELVRRSVEALNRRDLDVARAHGPQRRVHLAHRGAGERRLRHGHDGIRRWWEDLFGVFPDFRSEIEEVRDLGDVTVTRVRQHGQGVGSDAPTEETQWAVTEWRNGKAIWWRVCSSESDALEAAGLRE